MTTKKSEAQSKSIADQLSEFVIDRRNLIKKIKIGMQQSRKGQVISESELENCIAEWFQVNKE